jgi:hypothetical protein
MTNGGYRIVYIIDPDTSFLYPISAIRYRVSLVFLVFHVLDQAVAKGIDLGSYKFITRGA